MSYPLQEPKVRTVHEVQTLRQELADTRKKLQEYADTVVSLHGELRTLRDSICSTCKRNFVLANPISSQAAEPAADSSPPSQGPAQHNSTFSWRRLLKARAPASSGPPSSEIHRSTIAHTLKIFPSQPSHLLPIVSTPTYTPSPPPVLTTMLGNEKPALISHPLTTTTSSKTIIPKVVSSVLRWSAKRDATANAALAVSFERAFKHKVQVQSVCFSADGKYLAAARGERDSYEHGVTFVYNVETGDKICELAEYDSRDSSKTIAGVHCVCFSPDCRYLVVGNAAGRVLVWDIQNKRIRSIFTGHKYPVESVDFSPNGRLVVSVSWDDTVRIWNIRDGSAIFTGNGGSFWSVRFSPNGRYVAVGSYAGDLRIWDVRSGRLVKRWTRHQGYVHSVAFTPDGRGLVSGSGFGGVKYWDVSSLGVVQPGGELVPPEVLEYRGHTGIVSSVAISPHAQWIVSASYDKTAILLDTRNVMRQYTLIGHKGPVSSVAFSPVGGYLALGSHDHHVTLWRYTGT